eukprot:TRINITY_DN11257_c0_g1_i1.p1 TRINITY_DN11257_c0_g1~~TRINITY_DN11257_c0_g1_i1.p1  ORF type:complete len:262 (+),score=46.39 TRINITY_DN11257_c0_g1_i1:70-855(+)
MTVTDPAIESFNNNGYCVFDGLLQGSSLDELMQIVESKIINREKSDEDPSHWNSQGFLYSDTVGGRLFKVQAVAKYVPEVLEKLCKNELLLSKVRMIYENKKDGDGLPSELDCFGTKFFPMWPKVGKTVNWHQDSHFFGSKSAPGIVTAAVYLQDTDKENGCFRLVPKSHLSGQQPHAPGEGEWAEGEWMQVDEDKAIDVPCKAGSVVLFDARLAHAAHPNTSPDRTRYSMFFHYVPRSLQFGWAGVDYSSGKYDDRHAIY